jgi:hypothetical protein
MLDLLLESSLTIGVIGTVAAVATFFAWMQTGWKQLLLACIVVAMATPILVAVGMMFDSEREILRRFVYETAEELESNQYPKVVSKIHPQASVELQNIRDHLSEVRFLRVRVKSIQSADLTHHRTGVNARIAMNVYLEVEENFQRAGTPAWVQLILEQVDGKWLIVDIAYREAEEDLLHENPLSPFNILYP